MEAEGPAHSLPVALNLGVRKPSPLTRMPPQHMDAICIETGYLCDFRHGATAFRQLSLLPMRTGSVVTFGGSLCFGGFSFHCNDVWHALNHVKSFIIASIFNKFNCQLTLFEKVVKHSTVYAQPEFCAEIKRNFQSVLIG